VLEHCQAVLYAQRQRLTNEVDERVGHKSEVVSRSTIIGLPGQGGERHAQQHRRRRQKKPLTNDDRRPAHRKLRFAGRRSAPDSLLKDGIETLLILCPYLRKVDIAKHSDRFFSMFR
jgi:hypothetical protein